MDGTLVFAKTPKGIVEVSQRTAQLAMTVRRVLIMVDGKRTLEELSVLLRPGEVDTVIGQLEVAGLIQRATQNNPIDVPTISGGRDETMPVSSVGTNVDDPNPMTLEEAKRRAVRELNDRLGPDAESLAIRLERCRTIEDFRAGVREAERFVASMLGPAAGQDYLRALRRRN